MEYLIGSLEEFPLIYSTNVCWVPIWKCLYISYHLNLFETLLIYMFVYEYDQDIKQSTAFMELTF